MDLWLLIGKNQRERRVLACAEVILEKALVMYGHDPEQALVVPKAPAWLRSSFSARRGPG
jgi:hypothetical protein